VKFYCVFYLVCAFLSLGGAALTQGQEVESKLGVLLDTSAEMGFLVPQVRKEVRVLNARLEGQGRELVSLAEIEGASIGREASLSVPGSRNALYPIKKLFEVSKVDTVYWITSLKGLQSGAGFNALEELLDETPEGRPARKLVIRNIWQEQVQAGDQWMRNAPPPETDRLDPAVRPGEWYRLIGENRGIMIRSWQIPLDGHRKEFGFPWRIRHSAWLRKAGYTAPVEFDFSWARSLQQRHRLHFLGSREEWPSRITGRSWIFDHSLVPYPAESEEEWNAEVFGEMRKRDSIDSDLARIEGETIGVLSVFGYLQPDLDRFRLGEERARKTASFLYMKDLSELVKEVRESEQAWTKSGKEKDRVYLTEFLDRNRNGHSADALDPIALRIAQMAKGKSVDAVYLFTNGYLGGGPYGTFSMNLEQIESAVRSAGIRLYVRMPFETSPAPVTLQQLALASGGKTFLGSQGDPDWELKPLKPKWSSPTLEAE